MSSFLAIVLRFLTVLLLGWLAGTIVNAVGPQDGGANIGAGIISFAVTLVVAGVWGFFDGRRGPVGPTIMVWVIVAVLVGLATPFLISLSGHGFDWSVVRSDLIMVAPFTAGLVVVPAAVGVLLGNATGS